MGVLDLREETDMTREGLEQFLRLARAEPELGLSVTRIVALEEGAAEVLLALMERHGFSCPCCRAADLVHAVRARRDALLGGRAEAGVGDLDRLLGPIGQTPAGRAPEPAVSTVEAVGEAPAAPPSEPGEA
jgi:hypothetical protein